MSQNLQTSDHARDGAILEIWPDIIRLLHGAGIKHDVPIGQLSAQLRQLLRREF